MTIRSMIIEDEPLARRTLREFIASVKWLECVGEAADGQTAVRLIDKLEPDLIFLDVKMPELSGLEVLKRIRHEPTVVFTTAYDQYAISAFQLGALDYLMKPFGAARFQTTLKRIRERLPASATEPPVSERVQAVLGDHKWLKRIFARKADRIFPILIEHVTRFEACDDYVVLHANGETYLLLLTLSALEERLDPEQFLRVHRSHLINLNHITLMRAYDDRRLLITFKDGAEVLASRSGSQSLRRLIA